MIIEDLPEIKGKVLSIDTSLEIYKDERIRMWETIRKMEREG